MVLAISAAYNNDDSNPGFTVSVSGLTPYDTYKIVRISAGSVFADAPVRGADMVEVITDATSIDDYEMPLNFDFNWRVEGYVGGVLTDYSTTMSTGAVVAPNGFPAYYGSYWIKDIANPSKSRAVIISDFSEVEYDPVILGQYNVLGRDKPVVFTDVWGARQGSFEVLSVDLFGNQTSVKDMEDLLQSGDVLFYQTAYQSNVLKDMYFIVTSLNRTQYDKPSLTGELGFTYTVGYQEVDRPITSALPTGYGVWLDLESDPAYTDYNDVAADNATYEDVLNRYTV